MAIINFLLDPLSIPKLLNNEKKTNHTTYTEFENTFVFWVIRKNSFPQSSTKEEAFCNGVQFPEQSATSSSTNLSLCALQARTPENPPAIYRCKRGCGDTSGSQNFPIKSGIEKCARQQNSKSLCHNFSRKHSALIGTASNRPCYANPLTRER